MIAQRHQVHAIAQKLLVQRLGQARSVRRVLDIGDNAVNATFLHKPRYAFGDGRTSRPADDVAFERQLVDDVEDLVPVDEQRIFVSGFSNGASFANRVAIELPDRVAAVGASGGGPVIPAAFPSHDEPPADLWLIIGSADDRFLAGSGLDELPLDPAGMVTVPVLRAAMATHTLRWGLPIVPCQIDRRATSTTLVFCAPGRPEFRLSLVDDLTHVYPHGFDRRTNPSGIAAARVFWTFFAAHPLAEAP